jgi:mannose-6-phosphate isomerase-like protein (cupin superfamily)
VGEPIAVAPGEGEVIGDSPDRRVDLLSDDDSLHATWSRFAAGREGADLHVHHQHTDLFYVLDGELTIRLGLDDEQVTVPAGSLARVPPMVVHGFRNAGDADVTYLNLHAPGEGFARFMRGLRDGEPVTYDQHDPPDDGVRPASEAAIGERELMVHADQLRVDVLAEVDEIAVAEVRCEAGAHLLLSEGRPRHTESLYVLEGEIELAGGAREITAGARSWLQIPAGVSHAVEFTNGEPARFLVLQTPNGGLEAFRALGGG